MKVASVNAGNMGVGSGIAPGTDAETKNLQKRIQDKQTELQKLSENQNMDPEEKRKKRQAIQQEIADLNMQLREHQIEQRRERQPDKSSSSDERLGTKRDASASSQKGKTEGMSQTTMTAILSADSSAKLAQVQGNVSERMEGRAGVLRAEIKQDAAMGGNTSRKEEELAATEAKAANAEAAQMRTLGEADKTLKKASEKEQERKKDKDRMEEDRIKEDETETDPAGKYVDVRL